MSKKDEAVEGLGKIGKIVLNKSDTLKTISDGAEQVVKLGKSVRKSNREEKAIIGAGLSSYLVFLLFFPGNPIQKFFLGSSTGIATSFIVGAIFPDKQRRIRKEIDEEIAKEKRTFREECQLLASIRNGGEDEVYEIYSSLVLERLERQINVLNDLKEDISRDYYTRED